MNRSLLKFRYFLYTLPWDIGVVLLTIAPRQFPTNDLMGWILVASGSHLAMVPFFLYKPKIMSAIKLQRIEIGLLAVAGIIRGFALLGLSSLFGFPISYLVILALTH